MRAGQELPFTGKGRMRTSTVNQREPTLNVKSPMEGTLSRDEILFRSLIESCSDIITILDRGGSIRFGSAALERKLGFLPEEVIGRSGFDFVHPDDLDKAIARFEQALTNTAGGAPVELRLKHKRGGWRLFEAVSSPLGEGAVHRRLVCSFRDISDRKEEQAALIESESKFRAVADTATCAIYIHDSKRFLYVNRASIEISGYAREELLAMSPAEITDPDDREMVIERAIRRQAGNDVPTRCEFRILTKSGDIRWMDISASSIQFEGKTAIIVTGFDITERKRAEQLQMALYEIADRANSDQDLSHLFSGVHATLKKLIYAKNFYIALADEAGETIEFPYFVDEFDPPPLSRRMARGLTEYVLRTGEPLLIKPSLLRALVQQGDVERVGSPCIDWIGAPLKLGSRAFGVLAVQSYDEERRYQWKDAEVLNFVSQHLATAIERKRSRDALRASEQRHRSLVESAVYGMYRSTVQDHFVDVNPALVTMLGYDSAEELLKVSLSREVYVDPEERLQLIKAHQEKTAVSAEVKWKRKDGRIIMVRLSGRGTLDEKGETVGSEMIAEDITERRTLEAQFRQSQKMEAVGRLAGGIAHDFNNLLTVITGYSELMLHDLSENDPLRTEVDEIKKASDRAASLTTQLLAFSRQQVLAPKIIDLNSVIGNMERLLRRLLGEDIQLMTHLDSQLGNAKADPGQIEQVIMNLAVNARDAMEKGGKLIIETTNVVLDQDYSREHVSVKPGRYIMIAVSDTGIGMTAEVQSRVFEPFFTTKEVGKGTGLGLSTVYGIIKQSDGYIWCYSEPGIGTTFKIYLPTIDAPAEATSLRSPHQLSHRGTETVLLVEDEDGVRALIRQLLQKNGYTVLEARHGGEALLACERHGGKIDLLLTDVVLEQMTGRELTERLLPLRPDMRVLYVSGYTDDAIMQHGVLTPGTAFLQKPFTAESLTAKIRQVLETTPPT